MNSSKDVNLLIADLKSKGLPKVDCIIKTAEAEIGWSYVFGATGAFCIPSKRSYYANRPSCPPDESNEIRRKCQVLNGSKSACQGCKYLPGGEQTEIHDCWGFVKDIFQIYGINLSGYGCTSGWNADSNWAEKGQINTLPKDKLCCVFWTDSKDKNVKSHIGFSVGNGMMIHCSGEVKKEKLSAKCTDWAIPKGMEGDIPVPEPTHKTIRRGSSGPDVVKCQEDLIKLGYDLSPYNADGKFGSKTEAALKAFQKASGLVADGICGPRSWEALITAVGPKETLYTVEIKHLDLTQAMALTTAYANSEMKEEK